MQQVPKSDGYAKAQILYAQKKPRLGTAPYESIVTKAHYRIFAAIADPSIARDDPLGEYVTPRSEAQENLAPFSLMSSSALTIGVDESSDELSVSGLFSALGDEPSDSDSFVVSAVSGAPYLYQDEVTIPGAPATADDPAIDSVVVPRLWFNPRQNSSFDLSIPTPRPGWTDSFIPAITDQGWSVGSTNNAVGEAAGLYQTPDGGTPSQLVRISGTDASPAATPDAVTAPIDALDDWSDSSSISFAADGTAPTGTSIAVNPNYDGFQDGAGAVLNSRFTIITTPASDALSGIKFTRIERRAGAFNGSALNVDAVPTCGGLGDQGWGAWQQVGPTNPPASVVDDQSVGSTNACYQYRIVSGDNVGNERVVVANGTYFFDGAAPTQGGFAAGTHDRYLGQTQVKLAFARGSDPGNDASHQGSGIVTRRLSRRQTALDAAGACDSARWSAYSVIVPNLTTTGASTGGWKYTDGGLADATCYQYHFEQVDRAGNTSDLTSPFFEPTMKVDLKAPTLTSALYAVPRNDSRVAGSGFGTVVIRTNAGAVSLDADEVTPSTLYARSGMRSVTTPPLPGRYLINHAPAPAAGTWGPGKTFSGLTPYGSYLTHYVVPAGTPTNRYGRADVVASSFAEVDDSSPAGFHYLTSSYPLRVDIDNDKPTNLSLAATPEFTRGGHQFTYKDPRDANLGDVWVERRYSPVVSASATAPTASCAGNWSAWTRVPGEAGTTPDYDPDVPGRLDGCYDYRQVAVDVVGNRAEAPIQKPVWDDKVAPIATLDPIPQWASTARITLTFSASDVGVGLASVSITKHQGFAGSGGICGGGSWTNLTTNAAKGKQFLATTSIVDTALVDNACYEYFVEASDRSGNRSATIHSGVLRTGFTAPDVVLALRPGDNPTHQSINGRSIIVNPSSGAGSFNAEVTQVGPQVIAGVSFPTIATRGGGSWTTTTVSAVAPRYRANFAWTPNAPLSRTQTVASTTASGLTTNSAFDVVVDTTGPTGGSLAYTLQNGANPGASVIIGAGQDTGTGVVRTVLSRASAPVSNGACGSFEPFVEIARSPNTPYIDRSIVAGTCYRYSVDLVDGVQNTTTIRPNTVIAIGGATVDSTPPSAFTASVDPAVQAGITDGTAESACVGVPSFGGAPVNVSWVTSTDSDSGIAGYDITLDSMIVATTPAGAMSAAFTPAVGVADGAHVLRVIARNGAGLTTTATPDPITLVRDSVAPTATLAAPSSPIVHSPVLVQWTASDDRCLARTQLTVDGVVQATSAASGSSMSVTLAGGSHVISITAIDSAGNRASTQRTVLVDAAPPNIGAARFTAVSGATLQYASGTSLYFNPSGAGSFDLAFDVTDDTTVESVAFPDLDGATATGWTPAGSTVTTGGPAYVQRYAWSTGATVTAVDLSAVATDASGQTSTSTFQVRSDSTPPAGGSITYMDGPATGATIAVTTTAGSDGGSGVRSGSTRIETAAAPLSGGVCGTFGAYGSQIGVIASPTTVALGADGCYRYRLVDSDNVGNADMVASASTVQVDRTAPTGTITATGSATVTVSGTAQDTGTGLASINVSYNGPSSGYICAPPAGATFTCAWNTASLPSGVYTIVATLTDGASNATTLTQSLTAGTPSTAAGAVDTTFGSDGFVTQDVGSDIAAVGASTRTGSGDVLTVGSRQDPDGRRSIAMTEHTQDGQLVTTFGVNGIATYRFGLGSSAKAVAVDASGRIYAAGPVSDTPFATPRLGLFRFTPDGSIDTTFGNSGVALATYGSRFNEWGWTPTAVAFDAAGRIVVEGSVGSGANVATVVRFLPDGTLDSAFGTDGVSMTLPDGAWQSVGNTISLLPSGGMLVGGEVITPDGHYHGLTYQLDPDGTLDPTFGIGGIVLNAYGLSDAMVSKLIRQPDGSILTGVHSDTGAGLAVARLTANGDLDPTFGTGGVNRIGMTGQAIREFDMISTDDGLTITVGRVAFSTESIAVGRFTADGQLDASFGSNGLVTTAWPLGTFECTSVVQVPNGDVVVSGTGILANGKNRFVLVAYRT